MMDVNYDGAAIPVKNQVSLRALFNKQVWFVGLYCFSLIGLGATGAGVRWMLALI